MEDNIYWLFSTTAQTIATFVGFLTAGFFFVCEILDKHTDKDDTLKEINDRIKIGHYNKLKKLLLLTVLSIILSFIVLYLNRYFCAYCNKAYIAICVIVGGICIWNVVAAMRFVIFIVDPNKVANAVKSLVEEETNLFSTTEDETITVGNFLEKFIKMERLLRNLANKHEMSSTRNERDFFSLNEAVRFLSQREIINKEQYHELRDLIKIRNLVVHGETFQIKDTQGKNIDKLIAELETIENGSEM